MIDVKQILVKPIISSIANEFVKKNHYSGKIVSNSKLHFGAFYNNILHGVMSFGSPLDKRKVLPLVKGTLWNEMFELNRMAFDEVLPRNSESRCLSVAFKLIKKHYPHIKWILSFADGTQCGDGTIYRGAGFYLVKIKKNNSIYKNDKGDIGCVVTFSKSHYARNNKGSAGAVSILKKMNYKKELGYQLEYIYFIHKSEINNLTVPIIPFSEIEKRGAGMYKGIRKSSGSNVSSSISDNHSERGGAIPTLPLNSTPLDNSEKMN